MSLRTPTERTCRGRFRPFALAAGLALALAASAVPAPAQTAIKPGGTLVVAIADNPAHLNSGTIIDLNNSAVTGQIFDMLITNGVDMALRPGLATSWEKSADGLSYTFKLRPGVKWHDGKPFTSADVKYSVEEISSKHNSTGKSSFQALKSIETPDPLTVVFRLKGPDPVFFPWAFTQASGGHIYPKHIFEGTDPTTHPANFAPIGTGPFKFKEWIRGSHITLEKNQDYFDKDKVYLDRIVFQIIPEPSTRQIALEKGDVDHIVYAALPPSAVEPLAKGKETEVVDLPRPPQGIIIAFMNLRNEYLARKEVRHAISYAIDRNLLVKLALNGRGKPATGPVSSANTFYAPDVVKFSRDPEKAKKLLDAAGYPARGSAPRFSLRIIYQGSGEGGALQSAAEIMREHLKEVGIDLKLQPADPAAYIDTSFMKWDFDLAMGSYQTGPDPNIGVSRLYLTKFIAKRASANLMNYSNPQVDDLFDKAAFEVDDTKRGDLYRQAQKLMVEDLPALWLWEKTYPVASRKGLVGLPSGAQHNEPFVGVGWTK